MLKVRPLQILLHPIALSVIFTTLLLIISPFSIPPYKVKLLDSKPLRDQAVFFYADLDGDGVTELVQMINNLAGNCGVTISDTNGMIDQWNFNGRFEPESKRYIIGDQDKDGLAEIYYFSTRGDSILMHAIEYGMPPVVTVRNKFVDRLGMLTEKPDHKMVPGGVLDMDGDGISEVVFGFLGGFCKTPRRVYIYFTGTDSLARSPMFGLHYSNLLISDIDGDELPEIVVEGYAADNFRPGEVEYGDYSSWLMVLDNDLSYLFAPVEFPGRFSSLAVDIVRTREDGTGILALYQNKNLPGRLMFYDGQGTLLKERPVPSSDPLASSRFLPGTKDVAPFPVTAITGGYGIARVNEDLEVQWELNPDVQLISLGLDIDNDGDQEQITMNRDRSRYIIYRKNFRDPVEFDFPFQPEPPPYITTRRERDGTVQLSVSGTDRWSHYSYRANPVHEARFLLYFALFLLMLGFVMLIRSLHSLQQRKVTENQRKIASLQLATIKSQLDPHFVLNVFNNIASNILKDQKEIAYKRIVNLSKMVRNLLGSADKLICPLQEELEFVSNYLELEQARSGNAFSFEITKDDRIDENIPVLKMLLQIHAENAVKHGLQEKDGDGLLKISARMVFDKLVLEIEDNGIGRAKAAQQNQGNTGKGLNLVEKMIELYNKYNNKGISRQIIDLYDAHGEPAGTRVLIYLPLNLQGI